MTARTRPARTAIAMLAAAAFVSSGMAQACSCGELESRSGFIHPELTRLPANARGVLFDLPDTTPLFNLVYVFADGTELHGGAPQMPSARDFTIVSAGRRLKVALSHPDMSRGVAPTRVLYTRDAADADAYFNRERGQALDESMVRSGRFVDITRQVARLRSLLRVGPAEGFKPGKRYDIRYVKDGPLAVKAMTVTIDTARLESGPGRYRLTPDGAPVRERLMLAGGAACGMRRDVAVQRFHYSVPAGHRPYRRAIMTFSQSAPAPGATAAGRFVDIRYRAADCSDIPLGQTELGELRDLAHASCGQPLMVALRGWVGFLEVDDALEPTAPVVVDYSPVRPACR